MAVKAKTEPKTQTSQKSPHPGVSKAKQHYAETRAPPARSRSEVQHPRLSGHSQNPLSSSFPIIVILGQYSSALGVDLDPETHDIHHLLAVTPVRSIHRIKSLGAPNPPDIPIFSVQRLHGFRQVVQHVQFHVAIWD